jgi:RNA recognition motif-containing protein
MSEAEKQNQPTEEVKVVEPKEAKEKRKINREEFVSQPRAGRVIVRNIQYDMKDEHLRKVFAKYGKIVDISVPMKMENNLNRGFGFVEFETKEVAAKAIDAMHNTKWKGRTVAVGFSVPKGSYESRIEQVVAHTNMERKDAVLPRELREQRLEKEKAD